MVILKKVELINDVEMSDEEVWWYSWGYMDKELSLKLKNRFDKLVRACDWGNDE